MKWLVFYPSMSYDDCFLEVEKFRTKKDALAFIGSGFPHYILAKEEQIIDLCVLGRGEER